MPGKIIAAGHICIDITPGIPDMGTNEISEVLQPGKLISIGPADFSAGGSVSNTGLGLKILGADVLPMGKIGSDYFGDMLYKIFDGYGAAKGLIRSGHSSTSYSIVLAFPGIDRMFLNHPGANDTFTADDIPWEQVENAAEFHFGYPPVMKKLYQNEGSELEKILRKAHEAGAAVSLDLSAVDQRSEAGKADWKRILERALPWVDIFTPSVEELCFMLDRKRFDEWNRRAAGRDVCEVLDLENDIRPLAEICMNMGVKILLLKCGAPGMYLCTADVEMLKKISPRLELDIRSWADQEFFERSYIPERVLSGTGCGDTSIAAFLVSLMRGDSPEWAMHYAAAEGASCIAAYDARSGLKTLDELERKIRGGWAKVR